MDWADEQAKEVFDSLECTFQDLADDSQAARDVATIAVALRAERERCAKIADALAEDMKRGGNPIGPLFGAGWVHGAETIAARIRGGAV